MTRELKLALIVGFSLVLVVTVLVSDHLSKARRQSLAPPHNGMPLAMQPAPAVPEPIAEAYRAPVRETAVAPEPEVRFEQVAGPVHIDQSLSAPGPQIPEGFVPVNTRAGADPVPAPGPSATPIIKEPPATLAEQTHTVREGENLYQIARKYYGAGADWTKIARHNGVQPESLKVGMKLRLPGVQLAAAPQKPAEKPSRSAFTLYTVKQGDTLEGISRRMLGSPSRLRDLVRANGIEDSDSLRIGDTIKIPNS